MQLSGKRVIVTGAGKGIGKAIADRFAHEGARVMVHGHSAADAERAANEIVKAGLDATWCASDLAERVGCDHAIAETVARLGGVDILVNNAAWVVKSNLETTDAAVFDRAMAINVRAPLLLIRNCLPYFRSQGGGRVLNIGSINAYCGEANLLAYAISKGALMTLTRNLADAHGAEGIRVNQFNVGWVLTESEYALKVREGLPPDWPEKLPRSMAPGGRIFKPAEIANFAVAFVCDAAELLNGSVVDIEQFPLHGRNPVKESL